MKRIPVLRAREIVAALRKAGFEVDLSMEGTSHGQLYGGFLRRLG